jgi:hypothetical protein
VEARSEHPLYPDVSWPCCGANLNSPDDSYQGPTTTVSHGEFTATSSKVIVRFVVLPWTGFPVIGMLSASVGNSCPRSSECANRINENPNDQEAWIRYSSAAIWIVSRSPAISWWRRFPAGSMSRRVTCSTLSKCSRVRTTTQLLSWLEAIAQHADEQEADCKHAAIMFRFADRESIG